MNNRQQWLKERKKGIGGSDISAILGLNQYTTPYQLWLEKTNRVIAEPEYGVNNLGYDTSLSEEENPVLRRGKILEPAVVQFWQEDSKYKILEEDNDSNKIFYHKKYPFLFGTPDRIYTDDDNKKGVLECKTTLLNIDPDNIPQSWFCQLQWYMGICEHEIGEICYLGKYFNTERIKFNFVADFFELLVQKAVEFREKYIIADIAPEAINVSDIQEIYKRHTNGKVIEATAEVVEHIQKLKDLKNEIKKLEEVETKLGDSLKIMMQDSEAIMDGNKVLVTWRTASNSIRFDPDSFKKTNPEIYEKFQKVVPGSRRFLVK